MFIFISRQLQKAKPGAAFASGSCFHMLRCYMEAICNKNLKICINIKSIFVGQKKKGICIAK
jgi:hypothetical protein